MKGNIVLVPFPFDDFSSVKLRPAVCLTGQIGKYNHLVVAFISSRLPEEKTTSDIIIEPTDKNGLKTASVLQLHKIATIPSSLIKRELGHLTKPQIETVNSKLSALFNLSL